MSTFPKYDSTFDFNFSLPENLSRLSNINYRIVQSALISQILSLFTIIVALAWIVSTLQGKALWMIGLSISGVVLSTLTSYFYISGLFFSDSNEKKSSSFIPIICMIASVSWLTIIIFNPFATSNSSDLMLQLMILFSSALIVSFFAYTYPMEKQERQIYLARVVELIHSMEANYMNAEDKSSALSDMEKRDLSKVIEMLYTTSQSRIRSRWLPPLLVTTLISVLVLLINGA